MSEEIEAIKTIATHPVTAGGGAMALLTWLANKVYRGFGHRIANIESAHKLANEAAWRELERRRSADERIFNMMREHEQLDNERFERMNTESRDRHDELMAIIGDLRTDVAGIKQ